MAITSLPSDYGIGTLGDAAFNFVDLLVDLKQRYWQILPIGPTSFGDSPYQSISAFAGNPYLIDLDDLVKDGLLQETEIRSFNWGTDDADIDYATIYENRYKILRMAFSRFSAESEDFLAFTEKSDSWLSDYSLYTALKRHFGDIEWQSWDVPLRDRGTQWRRKSHYFRIFRLIFSNSLPPRVLWVRSLLLLPADAFFRYCPGVQPIC